MHEINVRPKCQTQLLNFIIFHFSTLKFALDYFNPLSFKIPQLGHRLNNYPFILLTLPKRHRFRLILKFNLIICFLF